MMNTKLFFGLNAEFDLSLNTKLKQLALFHLWDRGLQKYIFIFGLDKLHEVSSLIGGSLQFVPIDINKVLLYSNELTQEVVTDNWKGKSGYEVVEFNTLYRVISYQKQKGGKPCKQVHDVNKDTLLRVWKVCLNMKKDKWYAFKYVAERICREFQLTRFFREGSASFQEDKFQGSRCNKEYGKYYYYSLIVLAYLGLVERKGQRTMRLKDTWEEQVRIKVTSEPKGI